MGSEVTSFTHFDVEGHAYDPYFIGRNAGITGTEAVLKPPVASMEQLRCH